MGSDSSTTSPTNGTDVLLDSFVRGERGGKLRTQLSTRFPECSAEQIKEAVQYACKAFLDEAEEVSAPGKVYAWIRTAAFRYLNREADRQRRELAVDPVQDELATLAADEPGPAEELIALEDDADLTMLVDEVSSSLSDRRRDVLALYGAGYKRPQIADRLGLSERTVKRELLAIMDQARTILARLAGGGCLRGEPMVVRFVCGVSTPDESAQAREHLSHCERCELFSERLIAWREKAGAMLPAPVAEGVSPGVLERLAQKSAEVPSGGEGSGRPGRVCADGPHPEHLPLSRGDHHGSGSEKNAACVSAGTEAVSLLRLSFRSRSKATGAFCEIVKAEVRAHSLGQEMGQEPPQIPADPHVARSRENRLKSCPT